MNEPESVARTHTRTRTVTREIGLQVDRSPSWWWPLAALLPLLALLGLTLASCRGGIEDELTTGTRAALDARGFGDVKVRFNGREATVEGGVESAEQAAVIAQIVRQRTGVRSVADKLTVATLAVPTVPVSKVPISTASVSSAPLSADTAPTIVAAPTVPETSSAATAAVTPTTATTTAVTPTTVDLSTAELRDDIAELLAVKKIEFGTRSTELTAAGRAVVDEVAQLLAARPDVLVEVGGHTDSLGSAGLNRRLSQGRARSVMTELIARGIAADRLTAVGYGPERPIADNATPDGRQRNRRIEFLLRSR